MRLVAYMVECGDVLLDHGAREVKDVHKVRRSDGRVDVVMVLSEGPRLRVDEEQPVRVRRDGARSRTGR